MLENCLNYYGLYNDLNYSLSLLKLEQLAFLHHKSGYQNESSPSFSLSYFDIKKQLNIYLDHSYEQLIQDIFRYAAFFGIIKDVVVSPFHIEWKYNCFHQRDLFFSSLQLTNRQLNKSSYYL